MTEPFRPSSQQSLCHSAAKVTSHRAPPPAWALGPWPRPLARAKASPVPSIKVRILTPAAVRANCAFPLPRFLAQPGGVPAGGMHGEHMVQLYSWVPKMGKAATTAGPSRRQLVATLPLEYDGSYTSTAVVPCPMPCLRRPLRR